ncbi:MAG TPA: hypothetical protein VIY86_15280, partial [Pirellulaceae bacterium]
EVATAMLRRDSFPDPLHHRYGTRSKLENDPASYPAPSDLLVLFQSTHEQAEQALIAVSTVSLRGPNPLERARSLHPTLGDMLVTLMVKHESGHLGQLSAWRRAMGLPPVEM